MMPFIALSYCDWASNSPIAMAPTACYQQLVNPGFVGKARYALVQCFSELGEQFAIECFTRPDRVNRLYDIRNAINHGGIDAIDPQQLQRVETRCEMLSLMVLAMIGRIMPISVPDVRSGVEAIKQFEGSRLRN